VQRSISTLNAKGDEATLKPAVQPSSRP